MANPPPNRVESMQSRSQLTPRGAVIFGLVSIACSLMPILGGLGLLSAKPTAGTPGWVVVVSGLAFLFAGLILLSDAAAGGLGPDGEMLGPIPPWVKPFQAVMGFAVASAIASTASWVAFGSGERHFQTSISLPFFATRSSGSDTTGRWAFGIGAVLMWCVIGGVLVSAARKRLARNRDVTRG